MRTVSLILNTYNSEEKLEKIFTSIERQDYPLIEVIIKDGGSTDRTLHMIDVYSKISKYRVKWRTGNNNGICDAVNQGYLMSTGNIIVIFQGVFQESTAVSKMIQMIENDLECVGAYADITYISGKKVEKNRKIGKQKGLYLGWVPAISTLFLKREVYEKYGLYNLKYSNAAEYELMVRFLKDKNNRLAYLPETIARIYYGKGSVGKHWKFFKEAYEVLKNNGIRGTFIKFWMLTIYLTNMRL